MNKLGVKCASEKKMRNQVVTEWHIGEDVVCEFAPMLIGKDKKGKDLMGKRPMAYIRNLKDHIIKSLDLLER